MIRSLIFLFISIFLINCQSLKDYDTSTPDGAFKQADEYAKHGRVEEAIAQLRKIKQKFPYSSIGKRVDLRIADLYFERESYLEAQTAYQLYKDFYPNAENIDYIIYQTGMSYFNQLPEVIGRDLSTANDAIREFGELTIRFPNSKYAKEAEANKQKAIKLLAEKELYIADFYLKRKDYSSALGRYEDTLKKYSNLGFNKRALYGAAYCALKAEQFKTAKKYVDQLKELFANSDETKKIQEEINNVVR